MRSTTIHRNPVVLNVTRMLVILTVCLAGVQPAPALGTPIASRADLSNADRIGSASSIQPGIAPIPQMTVQDLITDLGDLDPQAINDKGQVVGRSTVSGDSHAYLWQNGELAALEGDWSSVSDINEQGQVVGRSSSLSGSHAYLWQDGEIKDLQTLGGTNSAAYGINNLGQVVGEAAIASGVRHAFLWQNEAMTDLKTLNAESSGLYSEAEAINDKGQVVGSSDSLPMGWTHAFLWQGGNMRNLGALPRGGDSFAMDINEDGLVVGYSETVFDNPSYGYYHAFIYKNYMMDLGTLGVPETSSYARAINDKGQVVGTSGITMWDSYRYAFLWQNGRMINLNHLFAGTGWTMNEISDINNVGQVVGKITLNADMYHVNRSILLQLPPDLTVESVAPVQVLENQDLVKYKATAVKAVIRKNGKGTVEKVPVKLVYGGSTYTSFYVADKKNIDTTTHALKADNAAYPLDFTDAEKDETKTIYFFGDGLAPQGNTFQASVTVNPKNEILELDEENNTMDSAKVSVYDTQWPPLSPWPDLNIYYVRADGLSDPDLNAFYTASNNFIKAVYPVAERRFLPGRASMTLNTTKERGIDGKFDSSELSLWMKQKLALLKLSYKDASRFVVTVPGGWFQAATIDTKEAPLTKFHGIFNTKNSELIIAEAIPAALPNGSNIVAHEIGHTFGLSLPPCEEYDPDCDRVVTGNGNPAAKGLWVDARIPMQIPDPRQILCLMGAWVPGFEYWVDAAHYSQLFNNHRVITTLNASDPMPEAGAILVVANFETNGSVTLDNWYTLPEAKLSELTPGPFLFEYQDADGNILDQRSFDVSFSMEGYLLPKAGFVATIPAIPGTAKIIIKYFETPEAEKVFSANAPAVTVLSPNGGEQLSGPSAIRWSSSDADGDTMTYAVLISPDNGTTWEPIEGDLTETSYTWDFSQLPPGAQYRIKVIATDGINTGYDLSNAPFTINGQTIYLPLVTHNR